MRRAGILLHISSLPGKYQIGSFGKEAYQFIDFLVSSKQTYWQVLPLGITSFGDSPYQSFSSFAINPYFIDLETLIEEKLLVLSDVKMIESDNEKVDYASLYHTRYRVLFAAFKRFDVNLDSFKLFCENEAYWLNDFSLFMALKKHYKGKSWNQFDDSIRYLEPNAVFYFKTLLQEDILFHQFMQYKAYQQYRKLKAYANKKGILIIGDIPIYVAYDSADVWANKANFLLDATANPLFVAGVPPDYFSKEGQLWGNPLYDWSYLKNNNYQFWIERLKSAHVLYDKIRIDHFIGFVKIYQIPYGSLNAINGFYVEGPKEDFFQVLYQALPNIDLIAEDLGVSFKEVTQLIEKLHIPGMKVLQFAFGSGNDNVYLPHNHVKNSVLYTGTHDNDTTYGWFKKLDRKTKKHCLTYLNYQGIDVVDALIKEAHKSVSDTVIIPLQDYLKLDSASRMNQPSLVGGNWMWRVSKKDLNTKFSKSIKDITVLYQRDR